MKDLDKLIEIEKERIIAVFREDGNRTKKQVDIAVEDGLKRFTNFADTLKIAYNARIIGPEDLLRTIEKGGTIYHKTVDVGEFNYGTTRADDFLENIAQREETFRSVTFTGNQKVTIIVEPLEEGKT